MHARLLTHLIFVPTTTDRAAPRGRRRRAGPRAAGAATRRRGRTGAPRRDRDHERCADARHAAARTASCSPRRPRRSPRSCAGRRPDASDAVAALRAIAASHTIVPSPFVPTAGRDRARARPRRGRATAAGRWSAQAFGSTLCSPTSRWSTTSPTTVCVGDLPTRSDRARHACCSRQPLRFTTAEPILVRRSTSRTTPRRRCSPTPAWRRTSRTARRPCSRPTTCWPTSRPCTSTAPAASARSSCCRRRRWRADAACSTRCSPALASSPILEAATPDRLFALATKKTVPRTRTLLTPTAAVPLPDASRRYAAPSTRCAA